jgi:hypothetical protein
MKTIFVLCKCTSIRTVFAPTLPSDQCANKCKVLTASLLRGSLGAARCVVRSLLRSHELGQATVDLGFLGSTLIHLSLLVVVWRETWDHIAWDSLGVVWEEHEHDAHVVLHKHAPHTVHRG